MLARLQKAAVLLFFGTYVIWFAAMVLLSAHQPPQTKVAKERSSADQGHEKHRFFGDWITHDAAGFFTFLLVIVGAGQAGLFVWQLRYMHQGVRDAEIAAKAATEGNKINRENFVALRRAWISIEDVKLLPPTEFTEERFTFRVSATVKHHGDTPATSVWVEFASYFPEDNAVKFTDAQEKFRTGLRGHWAEMGQSLFSGDTFTQIELWADGAEKIKNAIKTRPTGERKFGFVIFVGVSYRIVGDSAPHITQYAHGLLNVQMGTKVPDDRSIDLPREPFLAGVID
jgi:hypothetical protein